METQREILIGLAGSDHVAIVCGSRFDREGWKRAEVRVACDVWQGGFKTSFHRGELNRLAAELSELERALRGEVWFRPMESRIELRFSGDGKGHVSVQGRAASEPDVSLTIKFDMDQTFLKQIAADLLAADPGEP